MTNPILMPYKCVMLEDVTMVNAPYIPYIPLTVTTSIKFDEPTMKQYQSNDQIFSFYTDKHLNALEWIIKEAIGRHTLLWLDDHQYQVQVKFMDRDLAMLFKLKFFDV
jgi:hypothetical protein